MAARPAQPSGFAHGTPSLGTPAPGAADAAAPGASGGGSRRKGHQGYWQSPCTVQRQRGSAPAQRRDPGAPGPGALAAAFPRTSPRGAPTYTALDAGGTALGGGPLGGVRDRSLVAFLLRSGPGMAAPGVVESQGQRWNCAQGMQVHNARAKMPMDVVLDTPREKDRTKHHD